jgi:alanine racemase
MPGLQIVGVMTHFTGADAADLAGASSQLETFDRFLAIRAHSSTRVSC